MLVKVLGQRRLFPIGGTPEQRAGSIARLQRGRVARRQLLAGGVSESAIKGMLRRGLLRPDHAGVYTVLYEPPVRWGRETSALLACGDHALLSHASAAALWGLIPVAVEPVEVTVCGSQRGRTRPGIVVHRTARLLPRDVRIHQQLPVTSPAKTLVDFAGEASPRELERALDEGLEVLKIVRRGDIEDVIDRDPAREGVPLLRRLLARRGPAAITGSEAEELFLALVREAGLPAPETQVRVAGFTVDFFWREQRVAFEVDGYGFHTSRSAFDRDRRKDAALKAAGVDPNRVSRDQVKFERLTVVGYVAGALARAAASHPPTKGDQR